MRSLALLLGCLVPSYAFLVLHNNPSIFAVRKVSYCYSQRKRPPRPRFSPTAVHENMDMLLRFQSPRCCVSKVRLKSQRNANGLERREQGIAWGKPSQQNDEKMKKQRYQGTLLAAAQSSSSGEQVIKKRRGRPPASSNNAVTKLSSDQVSGAKKRGKKAAAAAAQMSYSSELVNFQDEERQIIRQHRTAEEEPDFSKLPSLLGLSTDKVPTAEELYAEVFANEQDFLQNKQKEMYQRKQIEAEMKEMLKKAQTNMGWRTDNLGDIVDDDAASESTSDAMFKGLSLAGSDDSYDDVTDTSDDMQIGNPEKWMSELFEEDKSREGSSSSSWKQLFSDPDALGIPDIQDKADFEAFMERTIKENMNPQATVAQKNKPQPKVRHKPEGVVIESLAGIDEYLRLQKLRPIEELDPENDGIDWTVKPGYEECPECGVAVPKEELERAEKMCDLCVLEKTNYLKGPDGSATFIGRTVLTDQEEGEAGGGEEYRLGEEDDGLAAAAVAAISGTALGKITVNGAGPSSSALSAKDTEGESSTLGSPSKKKTTRRKKGATTTAAGVDSDRVSDSNTTNPAAEERIAALEAEVLALREGMKKLNSAFLQVEMKMDMIVGSGGGGSVSVRQ